MRPASRPIIDNGRGLGEVASDLYSSQGEYQTSSSTASSGEYPVKVPARSYHIDDIVAPVASKMVLSPGAFSPIPNRPASSQGLSILSSSAPALPQTNPDWVWPSSLSRGAPRPILGSPKASTHARSAFPSSSSSQPSSMQPPHAPNMPGLMLSGRRHQCWTNAGVCRHISGLLHLFQPNSESELQRSEALFQVEALIKKALGAKMFPYGSFALKTYLPDSDINVCAFFTHNHHKTWGQRALKALARDDSAVAPLVEGAELISTPDSSKVVRARLGGFTFSICANVSPVLSSCALFEEVDRLLDQGHLFKRTILLAKAWASFDANVLDASHDLLSSYVVRSMVLFIFNAFHSQIETPLQALLMLFQYLTAFDWDRYAFGLFGPVHLSVLPRYESVVGEPCSWPSYAKPLISKALLSRYAVDPATNTTAENSFAGRVFNVIDPRNPVLNLGASLPPKAALFIRDQLTQTSKNALAAVDAWLPDDSPGALVAQLMPGTMARCLMLSPPPPTVSPVLDADLGQLVRHILQAGEFDMPDFNERDLVGLVVAILKENDGVVTVGKMGSLMHSMTNNHSLPAMLKTRYGGLKKLLRRHENVFALASDHPHNPHVMLLPGHEDALALWASNDYAPTSRSPSPPESVIPSTRLPATVSSSGTGVLSPVPKAPNAGHSIWPSSLSPRSASVPVHSMIVPRLQSHLSTTAWDPVAEDGRWSATPGPPGNASSSSWTPSLPDEFYCPISTVLMRDPVVAQDGVTYDRASLESLRQSNRAFSPLTGLPLDLAAVYPNLALKALLIKIRSDELVLTSRPATTLSRIGRYEHYASIWG